MPHDRDFAERPVAEPQWRERLRLYWALVRGDRPIGWLLLLWPTWWGLWLAAKGMPPLWPLVVFSLGVWLTRSAGCVINDYADRWLDPNVERTKQRPLATGAVTGQEALAVFAVLMLVAFALVLTLNRLTIWMSVVGVLLAASYPYLKRYTYLPQVYLGMAFGWGIPMGFAALTGGAALSTLFSVRSAAAFLVFTLLYTPCVAAVAAIRRELDSVWKTFGVVVFQCLLAWGLGAAVYQIALLI